MRALLLLFLTGCPVPPTTGARVQEAATEFNVNMRFGRMEMASEKVAAKHREDWGKRHKVWGNKVRIADTEMAGVKTISDKEAEVFVRVAWYRPEEQELKNTSIRQKWQNISGDWQLVSEERTEGEPGLFGESAPAPAASSAPPKKHATFPTIRIGGGTPSDD
jgi:hypothetical protein